MAAASSDLLVTPVTVILGNLSRTTLKSENLVCVLAEARAGIHAKISKVKPISHHDDYSTHDQSYF
jgi:hypothetical protein